MYKQILFLFVLIMILDLKAANISADYVVADASATLRQVNTSPQVDSRVITLRNYLESHKSPLAPHAEVFVYYADLYDIDYRLVPAIAGVESTFGKRIPKNSFNAYGWNNGNYRFKSWEDSIEVVSKTLREKYINRGATNIYAIGRRYAPPSKTWAGNVLFFVNKIDPATLEIALEG